MGTGGARASVARGNRTTSFCVGKVSVGAEMEKDAMRERMKEWICCVCCECEVKGMEHEAGNLAGKI